MRLYCKKLKPNIPKNDFNLKEKNDFNHKINYLLSK